MKQNKTTQPPQRPLALLQGLGKETLRGRNTFNINNKDMVRFVITDIAGKVLLQQRCVGVEKETIDIGLFKTGIYLLQLYKADNTCITQKLIKQ